MGELTFQTHLINKLCEIKAHLVVHHEVGLLPPVCSQKLLQAPQRLNLRTCHPQERVFLVDNLLVQFHLIIKMTSADRPFATGIPLSR